MFAATTNLVGGLMSMRIIHYFGMYVFIIFMFIHIYLANVEGFAPTKLMFIHKEHGGLVYDPDLHNIVGRTPTSTKGRARRSRKGRSRKGPPLFVARLPLTGHGVMLSRSDSPRFGEQDIESCSRSLRNSLGGHHPVSLRELYAIECKLRGDAAKIVA